VRPSIVRLRGAVLVVTLTLCACQVAPPIAPPPPAPRATYTAASFDSLPGWRDDRVGAAWPAFLVGCRALVASTALQTTWQTPCAAAALVDANDAAAVRSFFENHFSVYRIGASDGADTGLVTGYYEPLLRGSRTRSARYRFPLYGVPADLLTIDLSAVYPDLKNRRLRGRLEGNRVVPYFARGDIDRDDAPIRGSELIWVDDAVDAFFLHIQGSGQVELESGERVRVGYADQNGHPFKSLGRALIQRGELTYERASMQGIKEWVRRNPARAQEMLNTNPSYVFFRELPRELSGPLGSLGVPLTPERSIAVDARVVPLGVPVYVATTWPNAADPLNRLMVAQDTGGAIAGGVRVDFFWGFGDAAGSLAGRMRQQGRMWVLLPKGYVPPATP